MSVDKLKQAARSLIKQSYAPYSQFPVSAAFITEDGRIFSGVNVENASYGLTICAERNAIFQGVAQGARSIHTIVIYTPTTTPTPPCGACRQVIREFSSTARIVSICDSDAVLDTTIEHMLPGSFTL